MDKDYPDLIQARMAVTWEMNNPEVIFEMPLLDLTEDLLVNATVQIRDCPPAAVRAITWIQGEPWVLYYWDNNV